MYGRDMDVEIRHLLNNDLLFLVLQTVWNVIWFTSSCELSQIKFVAMISDSNFIVGVAQKD